MLFRDLVEVMLAQKDLRDKTFENYSGIASDVMVMPSVKIPEGCTVGAKSFIYTKNILEPWNVYLGNPLALHKPRNKENVINLSNDPNFCKVPK